MNISPDRMLGSFLREATAKIKQSEDKLATFIELRYYIMARLSPHDTFSVGQATLDFFETALAHLEGASFGGNDSEQSEYEKNYRRWIRAHQIKL